MRSLYWEISEKAAASLLATSHGNKTIKKMNVKFVLLSLLTKALPESQEVL